jgi:hypothetical protein
MKEKLLLDDWGPVPGPGMSAWDGLRTVGDVLLITACLVLGLLGLAVGAALYLAVLVALICATPFALAYDLFRRAGSGAATEAGP